MKLEFYGYNPINRFQISAGITLFGLAVAYFQWRKDVKLKLDEIKDEITVELVRQRIEVYKEFLSKLKLLSHINKEELTKNRKKILDFRNAIQDEMYGSVGLLASHHTRFIMGMLREYCRKYGTGEGIASDQEFEDLKKHSWALQLAIKSDLGIPQPEMNWLSAIDYLRKRDTKRTNTEIYNQVMSLNTHSFGKDSPKEFRKLKTVIFGDV